MIIPIKCFTCGNVLADKYLYYLKEVRKIKVTKNISDEVVYLDESKPLKTPEGEVLDKLNVSLLLNHLCIYWFQYLNTILEWKET